MLYIYTYIHAQVHTCISWSSLLSVSGSLARRWCIVWDTYIYTNIYTYMYIHIHIEICLLCVNTSYMYMYIYTEREIERERERKRQRVREGVREILISCTYTSTHSAYCLLPTTMLPAASCLDLLIPAWLKQSISFK